MISALALLLLAQAFSWNLLARTEGRAGQQTATSTVSSAQVNATLGADARSDDVTLSLAYLPQFVTGVPRSAQPTQFLHGGRGSLEWRASRIERVLLQESFIYGTYDFSPLVATGTTPARTRVDPRLAGGPSLRYVSTATSLAYERELDRLLRLSASVSYIASGGVDYPAQQRLPLQRSPQAGASLAWRATRQDTLALSANGSIALFTTGTTTQLASANASFRRDLERGRQLEVSAGVSVGRSRGAQAPPDRPASPVLSISLRQSIPLREGAFSASARLSLSSALDPYTGGVYDLADSRADLAWQLASGMAFIASGSFGRALNGSGPAQLVVADAGLSFAVGRQAALNAGFRGAWQRVLSGPDVLPTTFVWATVVGASFGERGRF